jgi:hypothetical protein
VDEPAKSIAPTPIPAPTGYARFEPGPEWPERSALTGLPASDAVTGRPALAVKIDNSPEGQPHYNLADADLVFEENVEGVTRFVAVFHTNTPDRIGPTRSGRTSDIDILAGLNRPIFAWSGGNGGVTRAVRGAAQAGWLVNLSNSSGGCFWRSSLRRSPHNLMLDPTCAWASGEFAGPARPVFTHDDPTGDGDEPDGVRRRRFDVEMEGITATWTYSESLGRYERSQRSAEHVDVDGERVGAENVVVLEVDYRRSPADPRSPEAVTVGYGPVVVHRNGVAIEGAWTRLDRLDPYTLRDADGDEITLAPGTTFVELADRDD